ncbi:MAG TPA: hypothetical protein VMR18_02410 [Candidatus Saccharimonadales bacterium]|jgi:hypothetical protein|nr:hypothetical protein [Candidatus Saccharimonadales bacterium]
MLDIGEGVMQTDLTPEAAIGRFFYESSDCYKFSESFWMEEEGLWEGEGLLPQGYGAIVQAGVGKTDELMPLDPEHPRDAVVSVYFDARERSGGIYWWYLCVAKADGGGRTMHALKILDGSISAKETVFDGQGKVCLPGEKDLSIFQALEAFGSVAKYVTDPIAISKRERLREAKIQEELEKAKAVAIGASLPEGKEPADKQKSSSIGYLAMMPFTQVTVRS